MLFNRKHRFYQNEKATLFVVKIKSNYIEFHSTKITSMRNFSENEWVQTSSQVFRQQKYRTATPQKLDYVIEPRAPRTTQKAFNKSQKHSSISSIDRQTRLTNSFQLQLSTNKQTAKQSCVIFNLSHRDAHFSLLP